MNTNLQSRIFFEVLRACLASRIEFLRYPKKRASVEWKRLINHIGFLAEVTTNYNTIAVLRDRWTKNLDKLDQCQPYEFWWSYGADASSPQIRTRFSRSPLFDLLFFTPSTIALVNFSSDLQKHLLRLKVFLLLEHLLRRGDFSILDNSNACCFILFAPLGSIFSLLCMKETKEATEITDLDLV